jgi:hypothetical protein
MRGVGFFRSGRWSAVFAQCTPGALSDCEDLAKGTTSERAGARPASTGSTGKWSDEGVW